MMTEPVIEELNGEYVVAGRLFKNKKDAEAHVLSLGSSQHYPPEKDIVTVIKQGKKFIFLHITLLVYVVFTVLLVSSYREKIVFPDAPVGAPAVFYTSSQGNFYYGLCTLALGSFVFLFLHFGPYSFFSSKSKDQTKLLLTLLGSVIYIFSNIITAKSLHYVAAFITLPIGVILFVFSWILGVIIFIKLR